MSEKSFVTLEMHACPVCGKEFETCNLLLDQQVRHIFDKYTTTGFELCEEHKRFAEERNVVFIIEAVNENKKVELPGMSVGLPADLLSALLGTDMKEKAGEHHFVLCEEHALVQAVHDVALELEAKADEHNGRMIVDSGYLTELFEKYIAPLVIDKL